MTQPLLALCVITYNREKYLQEFLLSLRNQDYSRLYELSILDNGSDQSIIEGISALAADLPAAVTIRRIEGNVVAWERLKQAASGTSAPFILVPGDDDLLLPNYLSSMHTLAEASPQPMLISGAVDLVDASSRRLGSRLVPPTFVDQPTALASLLSMSQYPMPASGFHRSILNKTLAPRTRSSLDWWLWLQCWLEGSAHVTQNSHVLYRTHSGQEQHRYGTDGKALDAARMLLPFVTSERFRSTVAGWSRQEVETFTDVVLSGRGPSWGEPRWSSIIQVTLADVIADSASPNAAKRLLADGAARLGVIASPGMINTLLQQPGADSLDPATWLHVPVDVNATGDCDRLTAWRRYLAVPSSRARTSAIALKMSCDHSQDHTVVVEITSAESLTTLLLSEDPSEAASARLLDEIGLAIGRFGGIGRPIGVEEQLISLVRWLRGRRWANGIVGFYRWASRQLR